MRDRQLDLVQSFSLRGPIPGEVETEAAGVERAMVTKVVERTAGRVRVEPAHGRGAAFRVTGPLRTSAGKGRHGTA